MLVLFLAAIVFCDPQFFSITTFKELKKCVGEKHVDEYSELGLCRHFKDHSEEIVYKSATEATHKMFNDNDCKGESHDMDIKMGCELAPHEHDRDFLLAFATDAPTGKLNRKFTTDAKCTGPYEGGMAYYPTQGECVRVEIERYNSMNYTCTATEVIFDVFFDRDCTSHSHKYTEKLGCAESKEVPGIYQELSCP